MRGLYLSVKSPSPLCKAADNSIRVYTSDVQHIAACTRVLAILQDLGLMDEGVHIGSEMETSAYGIATFHISSQVNSALQADRHYMQQHAREVKLVPIRAGIDLFCLYYGCKLVWRSR